MTSEQKRAYNREYMRRWRAANPERESITRASSHERRKLATDEAPDWRKHGRCAFCKQRRAITTIERLVMLASGFEQKVTLPYCGEC